MDRRSRERFIESNNQIAALVEKFKLEGGPYRKYAGPAVDIEHMENHQKIPLTAYGRPGFLTVLWQVWQTVLFRSVGNVLYFIVAAGTEGLGPTEPLPLGRIQKSFPQAASHAILFLPSLDILFQRISRCEYIA